MLESLLTLLSILCFAIGSVLCLTSALALLRMPDLYTRLHGSGCIDSLGSGLILLGLALQASSLIDVGKLILIYALILLTSPVAAHAIARYAREHGLEPVLDTPPPAPPTTSSASLDDNTH